MKERNLESTNLDKEIVFTGTKHHPLPRNGHEFYLYNSKNLNFTENMLR